MSSQLDKLTFRVTGMDCAGCARSIEKGVANLDGVVACELNFTSEILHVSGVVTADHIEHRIKELGFGVAPQDSDSSRAVTESGSQSFFHFLLSRLETKMALIGAILILPGLILHELLPGLAFESWIIDGMSVLSLVLAGYPVGQKAWRSLRINREININLLMTLAAVGALIIGEYTEAGVVMVLFALGEALEGYTADRTRRSIRTLIEVAPADANILLADGSTQSVSVDMLAVGDHILVKPGERIPMDGVVRAGQSAVNQAPITGESRLIDKDLDSPVFASSINGDGVLEIKVTHIAADNTIARLIKMVEEAQEKRAPVQRVVDQFAKYYTPAVVLIAILVAILPPLFFGQSFWNPSVTETGWLYRALTLLVVACPCALVISTPVSIVSAITNGARHGILLKGGAFVEAMSRVEAIVFDKTGTLTKGEPSVVQFAAADCDSCSGDEICGACNRLLALASAVEAQSEHPLATAVVAEAVAHGVDGSNLSVDHVRALVGRGVMGQVNGREVIIGSHAYFDQNVPHQAFCTAVQAVDAQGLTTLLVSEDNRYQGYLAVADTVRESSQRALTQLKELGISDLVMLTGDNQQTAVQVAEMVGVTSYQANCLPEDKVNAVKKLLEQHGSVAMIGDGINDAPALATASVGLAIGNTAQAMETADICLMGDSLELLPYLLRLCRSAMQTIRFNIFFSIATKLVFLLMVLFGAGSMWMAILADVGTSLLVTLNSMRLLRKRP